MIKVDKVETCACYNENFDRGTAFPGMPVLQVSPCKHYSAFCPICGRGGKMFYRSASLALKHWNAMQRAIKECEFMSDVPY